MSRPGLETDYTDGGYGPSKKTSVFGETRYNPTTQTTYTDTFSHGRLYVCHFPSNWRETDLWNVFKEFTSSINSIKVPARDEFQAGGANRGIGFVHFNKVTDAFSAVNKLNNTVPTGCDQAIVVKFANKPRNISAPKPTLLRQCTHYSQGMCHYGASCTFLHGSEPTAATHSTNPNLYAINGQFINPADLSIVDTNSAQYTNMTGTAASLSFAGAYPPVAQPISHSYPQQYPVPNVAAYSVPGQYPPSMTNGATQYPPVPQQQIPTSYPPCFPPLQQMHQQTPQSLAYQQVPMVQQHFQQPLQQPPLQQSVHQPLQQLSLQQSVQPQQSLAKLQEQSQKQTPFQTSSSLKAQSTQPCPSTSELTKSPV